MVGESGCGKTTVGRLIVGLEKPTSGTIRFAGADVADLAATQAAQYRRGIQYMFQDSAAAMDPRMRVGSIMREPMRLQHQGTADDQRRRVATLLDEVGLPATAVDRYPHEFSGGQRQRIGLARALALTPEVIIADEPVSALDVSVQAQVLNVLRDLQSAHGLTLIVISHDLAVIRYLADSIAVMYLGKLVEHGPAEQVYARPLHPYTSGLIAAVPVPDPRVERTRRAAGVTGELASAMNPPSGCRFRTRCPRASDVCAQQEPVLRVLAPGVHQVACHHPLNALADGREAAPAVQRRLMTAYRRPGAAPPRTRGATQDNSFQEVVMRSIGRLARAGIGALAIGSAVTLAACSGSSSPASSTSGGKPVSGGTAYFAENPASGPVDYIFPMVSLDLRPPRATSSSSSCSVPAAVLVRPGFLSRHREH